MSETDVKAPKWIRGTHPYTYRSGKWAKVVTVVEARERPCFLVEFPDGATDLWTCADPQEPYEFSYDDACPLAAASSSASESERPA